MVVNLISTPLDADELESARQYTTYFKMVQHFCKETPRVLLKRNLCTPSEIRFVEQYLQLLVNTIDTFRIKYLYNEEENLKIDRTLSGFPNFLEFRYLLNDLALRKQHLQKLPKAVLFKKEFLDTLLKEKNPVKTRRMYLASSLVYYKTVNPEKIFKRFIQGKIIRTVNKESVEHYLVSWCFFDIAANRPFINFMYFELKKDNLETYAQTIYDTLEKVADRKMNLDTMAYVIDKRLSNLIPLSIKQIDLGPIHSIFSRDADPVTRLLIKSVVEKTIDISSFIISLKIEELNSSGTIKEEKFFGSRELQLWETPVEKQYLFTNHRVIQLLNDKLPGEMHKLSQLPIEIDPLEL